MMRVAVLALVGGCFVEPGPPKVAPWQLVQVAQTHGGLITFSTLHANDLVVVAPQIDTLAAVPSVSDGQGNVYHHLDEAHVLDGSSDGVDLYYAIATSPGFDQVDIGGVYQGVCAWDFSGIATDATVDAAAAVVSTGSTPGVSPAITTARDGELVLAMIVAKGSYTSPIDNTFVLDCEDSGNLWAHIASTSAPAGTYTARWLGDSLPYVSSAVAFFTP